MRIDYYYKDAKCNLANLNEKSYSSDKMIRTWSKGGTMLAMFLTTKASPGSKFSICEGQTRESEQANTKNCINYQQNNQN